MQRAAVELKLRSGGIDINIAGHLKAHARFTLQSNGRFGGVFAMANDDGGANPKAHLAQHPSREHAAPHNGNACQQPHQQPPQTRRIPAGGRNECHVEDGQNTHQAEDVAQLVPEGATVAVVLKAHEEQHEAQKNQAAPGRIALHVLG